MINSRVIQVRLDKIRENVHYLRKAADMPYSEFAEDYLIRNGVEHILQISIQAIIDICAHIVRSAQIQTPTDLRSLPMILAKMSIIPDDLAKRISSMISMRNILVHEYLVIDESRVYDALRYDIDDFNEFACSIVGYLEKEGLV